jgi:2-octaprenyl-6-methoxyphenol hydroxylase
MSASTSALRYDIAVIGGGIVGTLTACLLKNTGLKIALIEAESRSEASDRGQAYSINLLSTQIFQGLGLWQRIRPSVETYSQVKLSDGNYSQVVHFSPEDVKSDLAVDIATGDRTLGYVAEHRVLLAELQDLLKRSTDSIHWFCPAKVIGIDWQNRNRGRGAIAQRRTGDWGRWGEISGAIAGWDQNHGLAILAILCGGDDSA